MPTREELYKSIDELKKQKDDIVKILNDYAEGRKNAEIKKSQLSSDIAMLEAQKKSAEEELANTKAKIADALKKHTGYVDAKLEEIKQLEDGAKGIFEDALSRDAQSREKGTEATKVLGNAIIKEKALADKLAQAEQLRREYEKSLSEANTNKEKSRLEREALARERAEVRAKVAELERRLASVQPLENQLTAKLKEVDMKELRADNLRKELEELKNHLQNVQAEVLNTKSKQALNERTLTDKGRRLDLLEKKIEGRERDVEYREDAVLLREKRVGNLVRKYKLKEELEKIE